MRVSFDDVQPARSAPSCWLYPIAEEGIDVHRLVGLFRTTPTPLLLWHQSDHGRIPLRESSFVAKVCMRDRRRNQSAYGEDDENGSAGQPVSAPRETKRARPS